MPTGDPTLGPTNNPTLNPTLPPTLSSTIFPTFEPTTNPTCVDQAPEVLYEQSTCNFEDFTVSTYDFDILQCSLHAQIDGIPYFAHRADPNSCEIPIDPSTDCQIESNNDYHVYQVQCTVGNQLDMLSLDCDRNTNIINNMNHT